MRCPQAQAGHRAPSPPPDGLFLLTEPRKSLFPLSWAVPACGRSVLVAEGSQAREFPRVSIARGLILPKAPLSLKFRGVSKAGTEPRGASEGRICCAPPHGKGETEAGSAEPTQRGLQTGLVS